MTTKLADEETKRTVWGRQAAATYVLVEMTKMDSACLTLHVIQNHVYEASIEEHAKITLVDKGGKHGWKPIMLEQGGK